MNTIHLTDAELAMVRNAVHSYLTAFGHDEAEIVQLCKSTMAKLGHATVDLEEPEQLIG